MNTPKEYQITDLLQSNANYQKIIDFITTKKQVDIYEIAKRLGLKRNTIYSYINPLIERKIIETTKSTEKKRGRPRFLIAFSQKFLISLKT